MNMSNQLSVIVDIDDTISQTQRTYLEHVNRISPRPYAYELLTRESREVDGNDYDTLVKQVMRNPAVVKSTVPYEDALDAVKRLHAAGVQIHIASSRKEDLHDVTLDWLAMHGFIDFVARVHGRLGSVSGNDFKVQAALACGAVAAFDDTYEVALAFAGVVPEVYLLDRPWNQSGSLPQNVIRSPGFGEAVDLFLSKHKPRH